MPDPNEIVTETLNKLSDLSEASKSEEPKLIEELSNAKDAEFETVKVEEASEPQPEGPSEEQGYTAEELEQYNKMVEAIQGMSLQQLQAFQRRANDRKRPQKEKALRKRRKAAKAKKKQRKHMKAKGRKKK